jgi:RNA polymerase sigma-70 factor (ECF subfamily)
MEQKQITMIEQIINGLHQSDDRMMKPLFDLYYTALCCFARRYVGDSAIAEEIVDDVFARIWQNRQAVYRADSFREYLYTATRNTALNYLKQQNSRRQLIDRWSALFYRDSMDETPLDILIVGELQVKFREAVNALPEQCRRAYRLSRFADLTYEEIADKMNISVNTVKLHVKTALKKLRIALSDFQN